MKKILAVLIAFLMLTSIALVFIKSANATHHATISWVGGANNAFLLDTRTINFPSGVENGFNATFSVYNIRNDTLHWSDDIITVRVVLTRDSSGVLFHFKEGHVFDPTGLPLNWVADPTEFDTANGWPGTVVFNALGAPDNPLLVNSTYYFNMVFDKGPQSFCNSTDALTVYTEDNGLAGGIPAAGTGHPLTELSGTLNIAAQADTTAPVITTVPVEGATVTGIKYACGNTYFNVSVTVADVSGGSCSYISGISNVTVMIDNGAYYSHTYPDTPHTDPVGGATTWTLPSADSGVLNLPAGSHILYVNAYDRAGNLGNVTVHFTYALPLLPLWNLIVMKPTYESSSSTDRNTLNVYSALKSWVDPYGLTQSEDMTYKQKVLGTNVTFSGANWDSGLDATVVINMPPECYVIPMQLVAKITTGSDGSFSTTFIFPQAPAGLYTANINVGSCSYTQTFNVIPEVIFNPDEIIGPAPINVTATGFTGRNQTEPSPSWMIMIPDALMYQNLQIQNWEIDANGTLHNLLNDYMNGTEVISTTLNWPWMQPGTYTVEIKHINGLWWTGTTFITLSPYIGGNIITVDETLSLLISIKNDTAYIRTGTDTINTKLDTLKPIIDRIDGNVVTINTTVGSIQATLDQLSPVITRIDGNVVTLSTEVGQINTTIATIGPQLAQMNWNDIATIKTSVGTDLTGQVTSIQGDTTTIKTDIGDVHGQLPNITNYIIIIIVLTLIAMIAAIACVFLVFSKIA